METTPTNSRKSVHQMLVEVRTKQWKEDEEKRLQREAVGVEQQERTLRQLKETASALGISEARQAVLDRMLELADAHEAEIDAVEDAIGEIINLEIEHQSSWQYDANHEKQPLDLAEANWFRLTLDVPYLVDITGDIRQQTAEALRAMADDLNQAAERLETVEFAETAEDCE